MKSKKLLIIVVIIFLGILLLSLLSAKIGDNKVTVQREKITQTEEAPNDPIILAAGDIANCKNLGPAEETARLLDTLPGTILTLGDTSYPDGEKWEFNKCYDPTWGRHKNRTKPVVGNHEYHTNNAGPYFDYFGDISGEKGKGYYSFNLGKWHVIALNSQLCDFEKCGSTSEQGKWLISDLEKYSAACTLAFMHHPLFSSGANNYNSHMRNIWQTLYKYNVDVVLAGHDHNYERFAPQDPQGKSDDSKGIRQFVIGTGGGELGGFSKIAANSEIRNNDTFGVLKMHLHPTSYNWEFIPVNGGKFTDKGSDTCR